MAGEPTADDPQYGLGRQEKIFPPVLRVQSVRDGEVLRVGTLALTAHLTPGHTPGSTTWSWQSCEGRRCLDSLNPVSAPGYRFSGGPRSPGTAELFRQSIAKVAALPCDIVIAVHPGFPHGCRRYAEDATKRLNTRLAEEGGRSLTGSLGPKDSGASAGLL